MTNFPVIIITTLGIVSGILGIFAYFEGEKKLFFKVKRYINDKVNVIKEVIAPSSKNKKSKIFIPFPNELPNGIIKRKKLEKKKKISNEVIAIELLTKKIQLMKQSTGKIDVFIDRSDVDYAVISNKGKKNLNDTIITNKKLHSLLEEDFAIQSFLNNYDKNSLKEIELENDQKMLRWASGGIIAVVEYEGEYWIPMFYRDIEPHGWNLFLGSSERYFDKNNKVISDIENELNYPTNFIAREFLEELLIFKNEPDSNKTENIVRPLALPIDAQSNIHNFNKKHIELRKEYDDLNIIMDKEYISCESLKTNMTLHIKSPEGEIVNRTTDVLVCFNLLELGIEVVKVIKFKLDSGNVLLDGEILSYIHEGKEKDELVRMPMALVSCDFLEKHFKGELENLVYDSIKDNASVKIREDSQHNDSRNFILFDYDLKQRLKVKRSEKSKVGVKELDRYRASFRSYFEEINPNIKDCNINNTKTIVRKDFTRHFTPATAKILNLFFNQVDPKEYKKL